MTLAVEDVRGLIAAKLTSIGQSVKRDRDDFDALTRPELPATLVDEPGMVSVDNIEGTAGGAAYHTAMLALTFAATTSAAAQTNFTAALTALTNDYSLGGKVLDILPVNYGGDENNGKDITAITLEIRVRFLTPPNDFGTLLT
jgi:hypothetical protein